MQTITIVGTFADYLRTDTTSEWAQDFSDRMDRERMTPATVADVAELAQILGMLSTPADVLVFARLVDDWTDPRSHVVTITGDAGTVVGQVNGGIVFGA